MTPPPWRAALGLALAALLCAQAACGQRAASGDPGNVTITVDRGFVRRHALYRPWSNDSDTFFLAPTRTDRPQRGRSGFDLDLSGASGDPRALLGALAVALALVVLTLAAEATYHQVHGLQLSLSVAGDGVSETFPIHWGDNRLRFSASSRARLADGSARLVLHATGTRPLNLPLPRTGLDWGCDGHAITLAASGDLIVDGRTVALPTAPEAPVQGVAPPRTPPP